MSADRFVNLHRHSSFSLYDGLDLTARGAERAAVLRQPALGLTDHGVAFGLIEHYRMCRAADVKPILGIEMYLVENLDKESHRYHQTVLAATQEGYSNLMRLLTLSYEQMYYKPRVTFDQLEEHRDGLVVMSGCPGSIINKLIAGGELDLAEFWFSRLHTSFGDRFYAEVMHHQATIQTVPTLVDLAQKYGVRLVATNDAHYVLKRDKALHDLLLRQRREGKGEENPSYGEDFHVLSRQEMEGALRRTHGWLTTRQVEEALDSTVEIAESVDFQFPKVERILPPMWGDDAMGLLRAKVASVPISARMHQNYIQRLNEELRVVEKLGYAEYFLMCEEVTSWARQQGIMIGPRGSVCGSLLAYLLGITTVDPMIHGTMFERFLHEHKKSLPDVDLDIDARHRDRLFQWVLNRYKGYAVPIATFGRWGAASVSKDLGEGLGMKESEVKTLRRAMEEFRRDHFFQIKPEQVLEKEGMTELASRYDLLAEMVTTLYSQVQYYGRHPAGVCFVPEDYHRWFGVAKVKENRVTTGNFFDLETLGLLKMDFLGLSAIATIAMTTELVRERHDERVQVQDIPMSDADTLARFATGDTDGIFQFETRGARDILRAIQPESFAEVAAATALNRPGVSENLKAYCAGKDGGTR